MARPLCSHLEAASFEPVSPMEYQCQECVKTGDSWVHLRKCVECGTVLCCDSSPNQHATKHHKASGHPVVISAEPGEYWAWCYVDEQISRYQ